MSKVSYFLSFSLLNSSEASYPSRVRVVSKIGSFSSKIAKLSFATPSPASASSMYMNAASW